ncbi:PA2169 family four-helix-bundle protein [Pelomonas sp. KK5]|uniref:ferritin-like domain-containing protein n=1 Tax=Pelomonas sp. KK5 TaxID=1855730 RepID=UPI001E30D6C5|nr:PA2169 family four-helix-bundle protein [Pelomonas sp. KK5]
MSTHTMTDESIDALNDLIENAKDGEYGFEECAKRVQSSALQGTLRRRAQECRNAAIELQSMVTRLGGEPAEGGTALGALHRGWISVKDALTPDSDRRILDEAERGEDSALARYRKALKAELTPEVRQLVERQMAGAKANHDEVKRLRDSTPA